MLTDHSIKGSGEVALAALLGAIGICMISSCAAPPASPAPASGTPDAQTPTLDTQVAQTPVSTVDAWQALLDVTPLSHTTPHPDPVQSDLDGTYAKLDPSLPQWWLCRRCADYRPAGGIWMLQFDRGVMRILYELIGWRSVASYSIVGDRLNLFNDPFCPQDAGEYSWRLEDSHVMLEVIEDPCAFGLRAENLTGQPWASCSPQASSPDDDWESPVGCFAGEPPDVVRSDLQVTVSVHPGNSRFYASPPDLIVPANQVDVASQEGIRITFDDDSISYGLNRVLWWDGDWIEISSDQPFVAMGVQFMGDPWIGWARVLFDGVEVWRGNTAEIWSEFGRHGGYVEISQIEPGSHSMRVESMGFDYHPVTVAWFGFSDDGSAQPE